MNRLARALLPIAQRALVAPKAEGQEDEERLSAALDAIDGFLAQPVASRYLAAVRTLGALRLLRRRSAEVGRLARRSIDAELDRLQSMQLLSTDASSPIAQLRALPTDPRAGRRLQALTALLDAHRAIAMRVRAPEKLRAKLEPTTSTRRKGERRADRRTPAPKKRRA